MPEHFGTDIGSPVGLPPPLQIRRDEEHLSARLRGPEAVHGPETQAGDGDAMARSHATQPSIRLTMPGQFDSPESFMVSIRRSISRTEAPRRGSRSSRSGNPARGIARTASGRYGQRGARAAKRRGRV